MINNLIIYLLQSAICMIVLYAVYWIFFRKDTFYTVNRFYLVIAAVLSLLLPLFNIDLTGKSPEYYGYILETITVSSVVIDNAISENLTVFEIFTVVYITGVILFLIRFLYQLFQLWRLIKKYSITKKDGLRIVFIDKNYSAFSFFNIIFLNKNNLGKKNIEEVLTHEQIHIKQSHSLDLLVLEVITILQWFNPFVWLYRSSLKSIHEFLADEGVLLKGFNKVNYQNLLLNLSMGIQVNDLTNNFNHSLIKRRIIMMTKTKSTSYAKWKFVFAVPVTFVLVLLFSFSTGNLAIGQSDAGTSPEKLADLYSMSQGEKVYAEVDKAPQFKGGQDGLIKFMIANFKYPEEARTKGISGSVTIQFVVDKNGVVTKAKVLKGIGGGCDEEALRVIRAMPKWIPGEQDGKTVNVEMKIPIKFNLDNKK